MKSFDGLEVPVLVYGAAVAGGGKRPVIMSIHGGFPFASTSRFDPSLALYVAEDTSSSNRTCALRRFGAAYERAALDHGVKKLDGVRDFRAWRNGSRRSPGRRRRMASWPQRRATTRCCA